MKIENIGLGYSPLSDMIYLYRHGKDKALALEKREAMKDFLVVLVQWMMSGIDGKGAKTTFRLGDKEYYLELKLVETGEGK